MVTAFSDLTDLVRGLQAGVDNFLTKPVDDRGLFARMWSLVASEYVDGGWASARACLGKSDFARWRYESYTEAGTDAQVLIVEDKEFYASH